MIIGICGKSGSGKTTLANEIIKLTENKAIHLDIDKVGHRSFGSNNDLCPTLSIQLYSKKRYG